MLGSLALLLGAAAWRTDKPPCAASPPPTLSFPTHTAPAAPVASVPVQPVQHEPPRVRRTPHEVAASTLAWIRSEVGTGEPHLEEDIVETAAWLCDRERIERVGVVALMSEFSRLPGVRKERRRVTTDHALRFIRQRLQCRGAAHLRATIIWVDEAPAATAKPQKIHWKVPSGVAGHVANARVQKPKRGLDILIGYEVPRRRAA